MGGAAIPGIPGAAGLAPPATPVDDGGGGLLYARLRLRWEDGRAAAALEKGRGLEKKKTHAQKKMA